MLNLLLVCMFFLKKNLPWITSNMLYAAVVSNGTTDSKLGTALSQGSPEVKMGAVSLFESGNLTNSVRIYSLCIYNCSINLLGKNDMNFLS